MIKEPERVVVFSGRQSLYPDPNLLPPPVKVPERRYPAKDIKLVSKSKAAKKSQKDMPVCACGCGKKTKGGKYKPGHDSKHRASQLVPKELPFCACECGKRTRGGRFIPGHDAKLHSRMLKEERAKAEQKKAGKKASKVHTMKASGAA